jgi:hypothetical protein
VITLAGFVARTSIFAAPPAVADAASKLLVVARW